MKVRDIILAVLLVCIAQSARAQQFRSANAHDVSVRGQRALDALLWIGELYNHPMGIVAADESISGTRVSVEASQVGFEDALARIMSQLPKYEAHDVRGVALIKPVSRDVATEQLFTMVLPNFDAAGPATITELADLLWMDVEVRIDPSIRGFAGIRHENNLKELQPIHLIEVTVEDVLNELVRKFRSAAWVGFSAPEVLRGVDRERLWSVVTYEDPPSPVEKLCCLNRANLSFPSQDNISRQAR